jgi:hypothetical protein
MGLAVGAVEEYMRGLAARGRLQKRVYVGSFGETSISKALTPWFKKLHKISTLCQLFLCLIVPFYLLLG